MQPKNLTKFSLIICVFPFIILHVAVIEAMPIDDKAFFFVEHWYLSAISVLFLILWIPKVIILMMYLIASLDKQKKHFVATNC